MKNRPVGPMPSPAVHGKPLPLLRIHWDHEPTPNPFKEGNSHGVDERLLPFREGNAGLQRGEEPRISTVNHARA